MAIPTVILVAILPLFFPFLFSLPMFNVDAVLLLISILLHFGCPMIIFHVSTDRSSARMVLITQLIDYVMVTAGIKSETKMKHVIAKDRV